MKKIFIICSKAFYGKIPSIKEELEKMGYDIYLPNCYDNITAEKESWKNGTHSDFKARMFKRSREEIKKVDAVLCLNFEKNNIKNYIGGATFLELYEAFMEGKKIFMFNDLPEGILYDELSGFSPIIINGDISLVR